MVCLFVVMSVGDVWIGGIDERYEGIWVWLFGDDFFKYSNWNLGKLKEIFISFMVL